MIIDEDVYVEHFGVKGMHWGQRKSGPGSKTAMRAARQVRKGSLFAAKTLGKAKDKFLDDLDVPGRPNRRSNRLTQEQKDHENRPAAKATKLFLAGGLMALGVRHILNARKGF